MKFIDYDWNLTGDRVLLDKELPVKDLGWKEGDFFRLEVEENGQFVLLKICPVEKFTRGFE